MQGLSRYWFEIIALPIDVKRQPSGE